MRLRCLALIALLSSCAPAPLSAYAPQATYQRACDAFRVTGDESLILVDVGAGEVAPLECADYPGIK